MLEWKFLSEIFQGNEKPFPAVCVNASLCISGLLGNNKWTDGEIIWQYSTVCYSTYAFKI